MKIIVYTANWCKMCKLLKTEVYTNLQKDTSHTWVFVDVDNTDDEDIPDKVPSVRVIKENETIYLEGYNEINQSLELLF